MHATAHALSTSTAELADAIAMTVPRGDRGALPARHRGRLA